MGPRGSWRRRRGPGGAAEATAEEEEEARRGSGGSTAVGGEPAGAGDTDGRLGKEREDPPECGEAGGGGRLRGGGRTKENLI